MILAWKVRTDALLKPHKPQLKQGIEIKNMNNPSTPNKINLVMFNMSTFYDWDHGIVNRNYNILNKLAKDERIEKIVAVDFLPIGFKKAAKHYLQNILFEPKSAEMIYGDLTTACYQKTDKIYIYTSIDSLFSLKTVAKEQRRVEKILNLKNIVFWSYNPMFVEFIGKLNEKMFIFDTVDNWSEHAGYAKLIKKKKLLQNYQTIAKKADLIFTVSNELKKFYQKFNRTNNVHWIPNGVDFDFFNDEQAIQKENLISNISEPIIGYFGTIQERVDLELIAKIAKKHLNKKIVLAGPIWPSIKKQFNLELGDLNNVITTGRIKYQDAPSYINRFDIAIIPHKVDEFIKSTNPMKMYEYLACGKPVVSTQGAGLDMFADHIYIADNHDEFKYFIDKAFEEDCAKLQAQRRNAVKTHSWTNRVKKMTDLMFNKL